MKILFLITLTASAFNVLGQNGFVKLQNDSTLTGYLRFYVSYQDGVQGIELWRTKNDKEPVKIPKPKIDEYAFKKDTFRVLQNFQPFHKSEIYFDLVDALVVSRGKVNLYLIENYLSKANMIAYDGIAPVRLVVDENMANKTSELYVLEDPKTGELKGLASKKEKIQDSLLDFFPERYLVKYEEVNGTINYRSIPELVRLYNSR